MVGVCVMHLGFSESKGCQNSHRHSNMDDLLYGRGMFWFCLLLIWMVLSTLAVLVGGGSYDCAEGMCVSETMGWDES